MRAICVLMLAGALIALGCKETPSSQPTSGQPGLSASASAPTFARPPVASAGASGSAVAPAADAGEAVGDAGTPPTEATDGGVALPEVDIENVGMHIGGGPNDADTKRPIREAIRRHYDAFRACFALVEDTSKYGTFGVDIRIDRDGGTAKVTKPRDGFRTAAFEKCMVAAFEKIEFPPPTTGKSMVVSYSLRFTPKH